MSGKHRYFEENTLKAKRLAIKSYVHREGQASHRFQMNNGEIHEGYIVEISKESIFFSRAFNPANPNADLSPFNIPIARITALID